MRTAAAVDRAACAQDHGHDQLILDGWLTNKTPDTVAGWIVSPSSHCLLALAGSAVVGVAILTRKGKIGLLHVDPDLLGQGIGTSLLNALNALEAQAEAWGWPVCGRHHLHRKSLLCRQGLYRGRDIQDRIRPRGHFDGQAAGAELRMQGWSRCETACRHNE